MVKAPIYTIKGTKTGEQTLPKDLFEVKPNLNLLAQVIHVFEDRSHGGLRNTLTRSEVNRTTKKVYKQKGTGGARHGSRRANVFVGGGVIFGPRPLHRILTLSKALKNKAKSYAFSLKASEKEVIVAAGIDKLSKTKEASEFLKKIGENKTAKYTFILSEKSRPANKFLRNLGAARSVFYKDINAYDVFVGGMLVMDKEIFEKEPKKVEKTIKKVSKKEILK
jgi:large subunit ribosomal protein L4